MEIPFGRELSDYPGSGFFYRKYPQWDTSGVELFFHPGENLFQKI
jgi:hypothetical protein